MPYPSAPWTLRGTAIQTLHWLDARRVQNFLSLGIDLIEMLPGKTLGSVYFATYGSGSDLEYHELIVACGIVRRGWQIGGWISHIYVDHPDSVAGGREIWGLPKELAEFEGSLGRTGQMTVRQGGQLLAELTYQPPLSLWSPPLAVPALSQLGDRLLSFTAQAQFRPGLLQSHLEIPGTSPFSPLDLGQPWVTLQLADLHLVVSAPVTVA